MPAEPRWLDVADVIELNRLIVAATSEPFSVRDVGLLESACFRPRHHFHYEGAADVVTLATVLLFAIARNHPFSQGNKRTGFEAAVIFLEANGYVLDLPDDEMFADKIVDLIAFECDEATLGDLLRPHVRAAL